MRLHISFLPLLALHSWQNSWNCEAFAKPMIAPPSFLSGLVPQLQSTQFKFRIAVGSKETPFQLNDMQVELSGTQRTRKSRSTGIHDATLVQSPSYVNRRGEQRIALEKGGWEVVWLPASPHGHLTCSFVTPTRPRNANDAWPFKPRHRRI